MAVTLLVAFMVAGTAFAQDRPLQFAQVTTIHVRTGMIPQFEDYMKKFVEAANKADVSQHWGTYRFVEGGKGRTYWFVMGFEKWEEKDTWTNWMELLDQVYGEKEAAQIYRSGSVTFESSENHVYRLLEDMSTKLTRTRTRYAMITDIKVKREKLPEFRHMLDKIKAAEEKSPDSRTASRWVCAFGPAPKYVTVRPFDKYAEGDSWPNQTEILREMYGDTETEAIQETMRTAIDDMHQFMIELRPELSRLREPRATEN
jgi:hypothetical protein